MEDKELIYVIVKGKPSSGKAQLTFFLKKLLREQGIEIDFFPNDSYQNEEDFDSIMGKDLDGAINHIKKTKKIILAETFILPRNSQPNE